MSFSRKTRPQFHNLKQNFKLKNRAKSTQRQAKQENQQKQFQKNVFPNDLTMKENQENFLAPVSHTRQITNKKAQEIITSKFMKNFPNMSYSLKNEFFSELNIPYEAYIDGLLNLIPETTDYQNEQNQMKKLTEKQEKKIIKKLKKQRSLNIQNELKNINPNFDIEKLSAIEMRSFLESLRSKQAEDEKSQLSIHEEKWKKNSQNVNSKLSTEDGYSPLVMYAHRENELVYQTIPKDDCCMEIKSSEKECDNSSANENNIEVMSELNIGLPSESQRVINNLQDFEPNFEMKLEEF